MGEECIDIMLNNEKQLKKSLDFDNILVSTICGVLDTDHLITSEKIISYLCNRHSIMIEYSYIDILENISQHYIDDDLSGNMVFFFIHLLWLDNRLKETIKLHNSKYIKCFRENYTMDFTNTRYHKSDCDLINKYHPYICDMKNIIISGKDLTLGGINSLLKNLNCENLKKLYIGNNKIFTNKYTDESFKKFLLYMSRFINLKDLSFTGNGESPKDINLLSLSLCDGKLRNKYERIYDILENKKNPFNEEKEELNEIIDEIIAHMNEKSNSENPNYVLFSYFIDKYWSNLPNIVSIPKPLQHKMVIENKRLIINIESQLHESILKTINGLHSLEFLEITFPKMSNMDLNNLCDRFANISELRLLKLKNTKLSSLESLCNSLSIVKNLRKIYISSSEPLNDEDIRDNNPDIDITICRRIVMYDLETESGKEFNLAECIKDNYDKFRLMYFLFYTSAKVGTLELVAPSNIGSDDFKEDKRKEAKIKSLEVLERLPVSDIILELCKKGNDVLKRELNSKHPMAYDLLSWCMTYQSNDVVELVGKNRIPNCSANSERDKVLESKETDLFFHGSGVGNWFSIIKDGFLESGSEEAKRKLGHTEAAYGQGVYLGGSFNDSYTYCKEYQEDHDKGLGTGYFLTMSLVELPSGKAEQKCGGYYTAKKEYCCIRLILMYKGEYNEIRNVNSSREADRKEILNHIKKLFPPK